MVSPHVPDDGRKRTFVLDTNVLLYDPDALFVFKEHDLVIPITVIEEIDRFKKDLNETGRNARVVSRHLDALRARGSLSEGVRLDSGGTLRVEVLVDQPGLPPGFRDGVNDNFILGTVRRLKERIADQEVVLVSRDTNMRLKADALGIRAEDYLHAHVSSTDHYTGFARLRVDDADMDRFQETGRLPVPEGFRPDPHQFVQLQSRQDPGRRLLARTAADRSELRRIRRFRQGIWGIRARNKEQLFAFNLLMDPEVVLVTLDGMAGTGKTLLVLAAALSQVADQGLYRRLVVSRPIFPLGRDVGFLPGDINEKLNPWMKPIFDNLELLGGPDAKDPKRTARNVQTLLDQRILEIEPLTYIRGRSLPQQFLVVDEAQNLTPHEVKTVLTRAGEGTKVVLTGDPMQIDNPYVDATSNGLSHVVERFRSHPAAGHVTLRKGERSELARAAAELL